MDSLEKKIDWNLFKKFKSCLLDDAVREINGRQRIPVTINELILSEYLKGYLVVSEPGRLWAVDYLVKFQWAEVNWRYGEDQEWHAFNLLPFFTGEEIQNLNDPNYRPCDWETESPWMLQLANTILRNNPEIMPDGIPDLDLSESVLSELAQQYHHWLRPDKKFISGLYKDLIRQVPFKSVNYALIARKLQAQYPEMDLLNLKDAVLKSTVMKLPNFLDHQSELTSDLLGAILTVWNQIRDNMPDDTQWDAWV